MTGDFGNASIPSPGHVDVCFVILEPELRYADQLGRMEMHRQRTYESRGGARDGSGLWGRDKETIAQQ